MTTKFDKALENILKSIEDVAENYRGNWQALPALVDAYSRVQAIALIEELGVQFKLANGSKEGTDDFSAGSQMDRLFGGRKN